MTEHTQYKETKTFDDIGDKDTETTKNTINRMCNIGSHIPHTKSHAYKIKMQLHCDTLSKIRLKQESQCTFTPQINRNCSVYNAKTNQNVMSLKKQRLIQQIIAKKNQEFERSCTFKPKLCAASKKIATKLKNNPKLKARYRTAYALKMHDDDDEMKECTFQPQINSLRNLNLSYVIDYMETDPFSRLSRTLTLKKQRGTTGNGEGFLHANGDRSGEYGNIINAQIKEGIKFEERQSLC
eukprot:480715_1